jgi:hypothetical protein
VYRPYQARLRAKREHARHLSWVHDWPQQTVHCECEFQIGRFRKRKALDCGKARCLLCSYDKIFGIASHKDRIRTLRCNDSLADYIEQCASRQ